MPAMSWRPCQGISRDVTQRLLPHYRSDWVQGFTWGTRILPPSLYIFFASVLPALAFGQQLATDTEGTLNVVHVLVSTALAGLTQALVGGQPLLIIGVAEPIVIVYGFMYSFARATPGLGVQLFLPWAAWVCVWTALLCGVLAVLGASEGIAYFTRFSGELFGALIAILFLQVGIKGIVHEFYPLQATTAGTSTSASSSSWQLVLINGLWSLLLSLALLFTCLQVLHARSWRLGRGWMRGFLADYGVPLMVVLWSGVSFAVAPAPQVPRRVATPNTWQVQDTWTVAARLGEVPGVFIAGALVPAIIISVLFFFDHNVSSQMAQQPEFNLVKGPAYHWDFLLLSLLTLACGLLGLPPVNGVLPQAPMHTRSLAHICQQQSEAYVGAKQQPVEQTDLADADADACSIHSASDSEAEWTSNCLGQVGQGRHTSKGGGMTDVTESLSNLQLTGAEVQQQQHQQADSTDAFALGGRLNPLQQQQHQQQAGVGALTTALSHMHLDTPGPPLTDHDSPFGTPTAARAGAVHASPFQPATHAALAAAATTTATSSLRHRQRSLSPTPTTGGFAAASIVAEPFDRKNHLRPMELQQQAQLSRGRRSRLLHPSGSDVAINTLPLSDSALPGTEQVGGRPEEQEEPGLLHGTYLRLEVREQRVSNLLQSLLVAACLGITPAIQQIPTGVLWGYFIFMSVKSLEGSQLWERLVLLVTDPKKRVAVLQQEHAAYLQLVPYKVVVSFTLLQLVYLLSVWALTTWAGVAGISFPIPIMALVPLRQFVLPRVFDRTHLSQLDAAQYEEAPPVPDKLRAARELYDLGAISEAPAASELPVSATGIGGRGGGGGNGGVAGCSFDEDEAEVVSREFHGLQIKHHLTREDLEQQQQQLRRRPQQQQ